MRFTLYTDKSVPQCVSALNERMEAKPTSTRPEMDGWTEKGGKFSVAVSCRVVGRFPRTTRMHGIMERDGGVTVIRGSVPDGADKNEQAIAFGALLVVGLFILANGDFMLGIVVAFVAAGIFIFLRGDRDNSEVLMREIRTVLKAKDTPPKPGGITKKPESPPRPMTVKKPVSARKPTTQVKKTVGAKTR